MSIPFPGFFETSKYIFAGVWMVLRVTWPYLLLIGAAKLLPDLVADFIKQQRFQKAGLPDVKRTTGRNFEEYLEHLFTRQGYRVKLTPYQGDYGADLILTSTDGTRTAVQCKRWNRPVGNDAVQAVFAAAAHYRCERTMVVTTSYYTDAAKTLARSTGTELWAVRDLARAMDEVRGASAKTAQSAARRSL